MNLWIFAIFCFSFFQLAICAEEGKYHPHYVSIPNPKLNCNYQVNIFKVEARDRRESFIWQVLFDVSKYRPYIY
jgi:hypothetical protein